MLLLIEVQFGIISILRRANQWSPEASKAMTVGGCWFLSLDQSTCVRVMGVFSLCIATPTLDAGWIPAYRQNPGKTPLNLFPPPSPLSHSFNAAWCLLLGERLDLHYNHNMGDRGARAIGRMLQSNTKLKKLYLWGNNIGDDGVMVIAAGLRHNTALEELYLNNNHEKIGDLACKYLGAYCVQQSEHILANKNGGCLVLLVGSFGYSPPFIRPTLHLFC